MASTHDHDSEAHTARRTAVALHLADAIEHAAKTAGLDYPLGAMAEHLPTLGWQLAVAAARELYPDWTPAADYVPHPKTRAAAIAVLRDRDAHQDPFDGFPTS